MNRDTVIVHAGYRRKSTAGPFLAGPQFSSTYSSPGDPAQHPLTYGRFHNPTWTAWEDALGVLDGGEAVAFASGMAAVDAVLGVTLKAGDVAVLPADSYYAIRRLASTWLESRGVQVRLVPTSGSDHLQALEGATLLWLETPSNPLLDVCDIQALAETARARGATVVVDNTTATAYLQQPLQLGATLVVASDTKGLTGHSDLLLGHVSTTDAGLGDALRAWRTHHGAIPGPMEVWLAHRSLPTLPVRMIRQCASAERLAACLASRADVAAVRYPGLPQHPAHAIAARQMRAFGTIVSFDLATRARAESFLGALTLVREATSFGGVHSIAERRARWGGDAVSEGFIRFSVGCEAAEDILADVGAALEASPPTP
ncbi:MAG: cystathionine gamma-lyase [Acidobacteria bacterium RIFCSPLOWO2_12_FULL_67_14]|nr:MAG: cystathionine gamma-lyase [Acidobacteria bacterium RIFCSPLOWO2_02_FULL_67_21]OFW35121.1 MAG: cystathionine gamma-lyase [Acidobacteria bacterium RIFCSPLOWO2_12_FULL_67_14]